MHMGTCQLDAGLLSSLREEVEVWKTKFQEQVEATAAAAVPNGESGDSAELDKALQDAAQAQEEASRWKAKAVAAQELEGAFKRFFFVCLCVVFGEHEAAVSRLLPACRRSTSTTLVFSR